MHELYRVVATVTTHHAEWETIRQIPTFQVFAWSQGEAERKALDILMDGIDDREVSVDVVREAACG